MEGVFGRENNAPVSQKRIIHKFGFGVALHGMIPQVDYRAKQTMCLAPILLLLL